MTAPSASARTCSSTGTGSDASSAHATVPPPRHARTARAAPVRSPSAPGSSATTASGAPAVYTIATGSASATRALRGTQLRRPRPGGGDQIGPDDVRIAGGHLDHHLPHIIGKLSHSDRRHYDVGQAEV